jgi:hypothetical protein
MRREGDDYESRTAFNYDTRTFNGDIKTVAQRQLCKLRADFYQLYHRCVQT